MPQHELTAQVQQFQNLAQSPVVPQDPFSQFSAVLGGFTGNQPMQMFQQQREQALKEKLSGIELGMKVQGLREKRSETILNMYGDILKNENLGADAHLLAAQGIDRILTERGTPLPAGMAAALGTRQLHLKDLPDILLSAKMGTPAETIAQKYRMTPQALQALLGRLETDDTLSSLLKLPTALERQTKAAELQGKLLDNAQKTLGLMTPKAAQDVLDWYTHIFKQDPRKATPEDLSTAFGKKLEWDQEQNRIKAAQGGFPPSQARDIANAEQFAKDLVVGGAIVTDPARWGAIKGLIGPPLTTGAGVRRFLGTQFPKGVAGGVPRDYVDLQTYVQASINFSRNALFGGALTPSEQAEYEKEAPIIEAHTEEIFKRKFELMQQRNAAILARVKELVALGGRDRVSTPQVVDIYRNHPLPPTPSTALKGERFIFNPATKKWGKVPMDAPLPGGWIEAR